MPRSPVISVPEVSGPPAWRGISHVHTVFSHDSKIRLKDAIKTAAELDLDYVLITDHGTIDGRAAYQKMDKSAAPLLIFGVEISTADGHLLALGVRENPPKTKDPRQLVAWIHSQGGYAVPAHALSSRTPWRNWDPALDGLEIYNFAHVFYLQNKFKLAAKSAFFTPGAFLRSAAEMPDGAFQRWDQELKKGPRAAFGGTDAHLHIKPLGLAPESLILYFQGVTMYALTEHLQEDEILRALGSGQSYLALEAVAPARGFSFRAGQGDIMAGPGEKTILSPGMQIEIRLPEEGEIRLVHNGQEIMRGKGRDLVYPVAQKGYYRTVIYQEGRIWIVSNPIYVE